MPIVGLRDTSGFTTTGQRPENWRETLLMLYPNSGNMQKAPLTALTSLLKSEVSTDSIFHNFTKKLDRRLLQLGADISNSDTSFTVLNNSTFPGARIVKIGDLLYSMQTGEIVRVSADPSSNTAITVTRGVAGTTATAITYNAAGINPNWLVMGSAFEEGSAAPSGVGYDPVERSNYLQIFRSSVEATRTAMKTRLRTGEHMKEAKREALEYVSVDMETGFIFGRKHATTLNNRPIRYNGGIVWYLEQYAPENIVTAAPVVTMEWLEVVMEQFFRYGSSEKMAFAGNLALLAINQAVRKNAQWNIQNGLKEFGMNVTRLTTPFGELVLKPHPLFTQNVGGVTGGAPYSGMNSWLLGLDMENLRYRYLTDSDLDYKTDQQTPGQDASKAGWLAECGIEALFPETHFLIKGLTRGGADGAA